MSVQQPGARVAGCCVEGLLFCLSFFRSHSISLPCCSNTFQTSIVGCTKTGPLATGSAVVVSLSNSLFVCLSICLRLLRPTAHTSSVLRFRFSFRRSCSRSTCLIALAGFCDGLGGFIAVFYCSQLSPFSS